LSSDFHLQQAERYLHEQIPLTRAMGVRVVAADESGLVLEAPLALNHNHLGTAFGGSLNALATLAGYAFLWLVLDDPHCHVLIRRSSIVFQRPVRGNLRAVCRPPEPAALTAFKAGFASKQKARMELDVLIIEEGLTAVEFRGTFVARK
jgi:thioesterase domain-containing protein